MARYGLYWMVQEIIAEQMEGKDPSCSVCYPISVWSHLLVTRGSLVFSTLSTLAVTGVVTVERDGNDIRVTNRKLLKYRDEYARKSGHTPDKLPARTEGEGEGEKNKAATPKTGGSLLEEKASAPRLVSKKETPLPPQVDLNVWQDWVEMRKKCRAPFTDAAREGIIADLHKLVGLGINPNQRLADGIKGGWRGVLFADDKPSKTNPLFGVKFANGVQQ